MDNPIIISSVSGPPIEVGYPHDESMLIVTPPYVNPIPLSNPDWWFEADSIDGYSDDDLLDEWVNISSRGTAWNLDKYSDATRPAYKTNQVNGLPAVRFVNTTVGKLMNAPVGDPRNITQNVSHLSVVLVVKYDSVASAQAGFYAMTGPGLARFFLGHGLTTLERFSGGGRRLDADSGRWVESTQTINTSLWYVHIGVADWFNQTFRQYINGELDGEDLSFHSGGNTSNTSGALTALSNDGTTDQTLHIASALTFPKVLTTEEISSITNHLALKYGITLP